MQRALRCAFDRLYDAGRLKAAPCAIFVASDELYFERCRAMIVGDMHDAPRLLPRDDIL